MLKQTQEQLSRIISEVKDICSDTEVTIILDENDEQSSELIRQALIAEGYRNISGVRSTIREDKRLWVVGRFMADAIVIAFT